MATAEPAERDQKRAIFVGNLPFDIEDDDVRDHFIDCGKVNHNSVLRTFYLLRLLAFFFELEDEVFLFGDITIIKDCQSWARKISPNLN